MGKVCSAYILVIFCEFHQISTYSYNLWSVAAAPPHLCGARCVADASCSAKAVRTAKQRLIWALGPAEKTCVLCAKWHQVIVLWIENDRSSKFLLLAQNCTRQRSLWCVQLRHLQARTERDHHLNRNPKLVPSLRLTLIGWNLFCGYKYCSISHIFAPWFLLPYKVSPTFSTAPSAGGAWDTLARTGTCLRVGLRNHLESFFYWKTATAYAGKGMKQESQDYLHNRGMEELEMELIISWSKPMSSPKNK